MPAHYSKARKRWVYEFDRSIDGRRQRACKLLPREWTREAAEAYARQQDAKLYATATGVKQDWLIADAVLAYLVEHAPGLKNRDKLTSDLALVRDCIKGRRIEELPEVVAQYRADNKSLSPATIKVRMSYLRAACRWAWKHKGMGQSDPGARVVMPTVKNARTVYIQRKEMLQIARRIKNPDARAVVLVAFYSGMRISEITRCRVEAGAWTLDDTKNGTPRIVPVHRRLAHIARRWPRAISNRAIEANFRAAANAAGRQDLRFHDLRHSTASALLAEGVDLYTVGAVLGHKATASTQRYGHLATKALAAAIGRL